MRTAKRILSLLLVLILMAGLSTMAFAATGGTVNPGSGAFGQFGGGNGGGGSGSHGGRDDSPADTDEVPGYADCPRDHTCPAYVFADLNLNLWYHDGIHYCVDKGLMNGMGVALFDPNGITTRGQIVTILWRLEGEPAVLEACPFTDVAAGAYYEDAITWATNNKIADGYGDGRFGPNDPITREQLAKILYGYAQMKGVGFEELWASRLDFADVDQVSDWAYEGLCWMTVNGIINGVGDNRLDPKGTATRAQAAAMIQRFCELLEN